VSEDHPGDAPAPEHPMVTWHCPLYPAGHVVPRHRHLRAQLLYAASGIMTVVTEGGTWTVPPQQAVWIPPEVGHEVRMPCPVSMRSLYIHPGSVQGLPRVCRVVQVTPLLRELIARLVAPGAARSRDRVTRLMAVLVDEVMTLESPPLHLPAPRDSRLRTLTDALVEDPADPRGLGEWAGVAGASERTLARLFLRETGMGFREWRQRLRLLAAIERLAAGDDVTSVSLDLGYRSPSAFIAMFKRVLGETPGRYVRG
jgi:AraC-like DNA-binding protein